MGLMNRWEVPESIFEPLVAAVPPGTEWSGFSDPFFAAARSLPVASSTVGRTRGGPALLERRVVAYSTEEARPYHVRARLIDRIRDDQQPAKGSGILWEVGMLVARKGLCGPAVPDEFDCALLQVTILQVTAEGVPGSPQLALLRHLWAQAVLAASPEAIMFGGQHHWNDEWWTESISPPSL